MKEEQTTRKRYFEYPYGHAVTLRKSGVSKKDWEYIVHKFGITSIEPEDILSMTIEGEDDYGRLQLSIIAAE